MRIKRALISVSDKTGLEELVRTLAGFGVEMISTGGTAKAIKALGIPVTDISDHTGFPEMLDGRVKTLHPVIHAGLLALRDKKEHVETMRERKIPYIDMVVVNLYPFERTVSRPDVTLEEAIENIDIGGPSMLRSAAKNYRSVAVVSSPDQYKNVIKELVGKKGEISQDTLKELAVKVFERTSAYDRAICQYLSGLVASGSPALSEVEGSLGMKLPDTMTLKLEKVSGLRYGENPHQEGAFYKDALRGAAGLAAAEKLQGKELSFNNILDLGAAFEMVLSFEKPAVSIVKHNNPCGMSEADTIDKAFIDALDSDRMSAFGGIIAFNRAISERTAELVIKEGGFIECIIAPDYDEKALELFRKKQNLRLLKMVFSRQDFIGELDIKKVLGGFLVQEKDFKEISKKDLRTVTRVKPDENMIESLLFAWKAVKFVKSNAIVLCQGTKTVGIGAGQMARVDSVMSAIRKSGEKAKGACLASDAFFPMPDSIEEAHKAGITAIIQPGGSVKDSEVIAACDKYGIAMVFTGVRHFRH